MQLFFVLGLRRSGNHAVVASIIANFKTVLFYNNVNHQRTYRPERDNACGIPVADKFSETPEAIIYSFEDATVARFQTLTNAICAKFPGVPCRRIVVCRDLLNMLASRGAKHYETTDTVVMLWKQHVRAPYTIIKYNQFIANPIYNASLAQKLNLPALKVQPTVPQYGSGSSFAQSSREPQSTNDYLTRYQQVPVRVSALVRRNLCLSEQFFCIKYFSKPTPHSE